MKGRPNLLRNWLLYSLVYFSLAMLCLETRDPWSLSSNIWLPSGLTLGVLFFYPKAYWPLWLVSAGVLHTGASMLYARPFDISFIFTIIDLVILLPLAILCHNIFCAHRNYNGLTTKVMLLLLGIYTTSLAGGLLSVLMLKLMAYPVMIGHFSSWALANATGCLVCAPFFIFSWGGRNKGWSMKWNHGVLLLLITTIVLIPSALIYDVSHKQTLLYLALSGILILALSLPIHLFAVFVLYLSFLVDLTTLFGMGLLSSPDSAGIQNSQLYLLVAISLGLVIISYKQEHAINTSEQQKRLTLLCHLLEDKQPVFFYFSSKTGSLSWFGCRSIFGIDPNELSALLLLLARIHPDDRNIFVTSLSTHSCQMGCCGHYSIRFLLSDQQYHSVRYSCTPSYRRPGAMGVLVLET